MYVNSELVTKIFKNNKERKDSIKIIEKPSAEMCLSCKATKLLCGKNVCPILVNYQSWDKNRNEIESEIIQGSSPPGVFIGHFGYPNVSIAPLVSPESKNTEILDTPELWFGKSIMEIINFRYSLVRGNIRTNVNNIQKPNKVLEQLQEISMAENSVDSELQLTKKPEQTLILSEDSQPLGPSATLKNLITANPSLDQRIEKAYYDRDLRATDAVTSLYQNDVRISKIQKSLSTGSLGLGVFRKLVPTKWSITAVDDMISLFLIKKIKDHSTVDKFTVFTLNYLDNIYLAILSPEFWKFEWIEAWFPKTIWNQHGSEPYIMGDFETYHGKKKYANVGGCYYSSRLAATEKLNKERKQATVTILREIHSGYFMPVGVWNVRESVRMMFKNKPEIFDTLQEALNFASKKLTIPIQKWVGNSTLLKDQLQQKKITDY